MQTKYGKILNFILSSLVFLLISLQAGAANKPLLVNQLKNHTSPYLALHGEDPVAWQDWSENAVTLARKQNKLLYLSIGYFSCHWCHVMQQESYRNPKIAAFLNKHFIPVKIDRELEPALDARMIEFVEQTRGMGGWPLNVFITPDGYPLYAVLYEPPGNFQEILKKLNDLWVKDPEELKNLALDHVQTAKGPGAPRIEKDKVKTYLDRLVMGVRGYADSLNGGFGEQSKFPSVPQLTFLVDYVKQTDDARLKEILVLTLDQMATLGLRDHLAGGFFRYTVDPGWTTPHFEKMLYDNAQLASIYLQASQLLKRPDYQLVAVDTLDFLLAGMRDKQGAFIASLSAVDDKGIEGGNYLWSKDQLKKILSAKEYQVFLLAWSIRDAPPFDQGYLPITGSPIREIAKTTGLKLDDVEKLLQRAKVKLLEQRNKRNLPRDTKLLAGWNGLALKALSETAKVTESVKFKNAAQEVRDYIINNLWDGDSLKRSV
ncbi:MAG: thioredoxin domain-containing protein, partial [Acidiferrobacterales bacterium]